MMFLTRSALAALAGAAFAFPFAAQAELTNDPLIGPGLRWRPAYDGSASQHTELVPVVRYLGQPWFVRSTQGVFEGGWRTEVFPGLHAGAQLAYEPGRRVGESAFLQSRNLPGIRRGASIGLQAEWDHSFGPVPVTLLGRLRRNIDTDLGTQADLRLSAGVFQSGRFGAGVFTQAIWGSAKSAA
jgi:outer membrane scaffolding protein for murein synthesis (MipA/OmpV family)